MDDLPAIRTLNGKFDARCRHCLRPVWRLWVDERPPGGGCSDGYDHDISKCSAVYVAMIGIVIREDHLQKPLVAEQEYLLKLLGEKAPALLAHIRAGGEPPRHKPREPIYDDPTPRAN